MKQLFENFRRWVNEAKELVCPAPTQDLELNTKNRNAAIEAEHIQYGPLNLSDEDYWVRAAQHWNTEVDAAKQSKCSNCVAFDLSPRMKECMPGSVQEDGELGYCWMHHFKCHSARTCYTWAAGGPITDDAVSAEWQEKNEDTIEEKEFPDLSGDGKVTQKDILIGKGVLDKDGEAKMEEAEYKGKKVKLNDPIRTSGGPKKFKVYVKNEKGNVVMVRFGDPNMEIKRDDPKRRKSFRARHKCDNPGPKWKARYWSCWQWRAGSKVDN